MSRDPRTPDVEATPPPTVKRVGLTGGIASGKSTVARLLARKGAGVIDSDALARQTTDQPEVLGQIPVGLGADYAVRGRLVRARLADTVFSDPRAKDQLERIVHPWVRARSRALQLHLEEAQRVPLIVHDIPLLFESGLEGAFDAVIVVNAPQETRAQRAEQRSGLDGEQFRVRDAAQLPLEQKLARADHVIENSGDLQDLERQVDELWEELVDGTAVRPGKRDG